MNKKLSPGVILLGIFSIGVALFPPRDTDNVAVICLMALAFLLIGLGFSLRVATMSLKELLAIVAPIMMAVGLTTAAVCLFHNPRLYFWLGLAIMATGGLLLFASNQMPHKPLVRKSVKDSKPTTTG